MITMNARHIKLEGDNYTIGKKLGAMVQAVPELANSHIIPVPVFSKGNEEKVLKLFDRFCPGINEEITGFSDILKVPAEQILYYALSYMEPGCSQMVLLPTKADNGHTLIARNYDFSEKMDDMMLCTTKISGRYAHIASSSVLFGRSDGMNECGLAVTMTSAGLPVSNMEGAPRRPAVEGLVYWAVIRSVLENCANVEDAINYVKEMPIAFNLNLLVADKSNRAALMETYDGRFAVKCIDEFTPEQLLYSTNHVCLPELSHFEEHKLKHSLVRYERIGEMLSKDKISQEDIKNFLSTKYPQGLMFNYYDEMLGTLRSVIYDTNSGEVKLCFGSPDINEWRSYRIDTDISQRIIPVLLQKETAGNILFEMV